MKCKRKKKQKKLSQKVIVVFKVHKIWNKMGLLRMLRQLAMEMVPVASNLVKSLILHVLIRFKIMLIGIRIKEQSKKWMMNLKIANSPNIVRETFNNSNFQGTIVQDQKNQ